MTWSYKHFIYEYKQLFKGLNMRMFNAAMTWHGPANQLYINLQLYKTYIRMYNAVMAYDTIMHLCNI